MNRIKTRFNRIKELIEIKNENDSMWEEFEIRVEQVLARVKEETSVSFIYNKTTSNKYFEKISLTLNTVVPSRDYGSLNFVQTKSMNIATYIVDPHLINLTESNTVEYYEEHEPSEVDDEKIIEYVTIYLDKIIAWEENQMDIDEIVKI